jgi:hypothetical protein
VGQKTFSVVGPLGCQLAVFPMTVTLLSGNQALTDMTLPDRR